MDSSQLRPVQPAAAAGRHRAALAAGPYLGEESTSLKLEARFVAELVENLRDAGHQMEMLDQDFSDTMGHAGTVVRHPDGVIEGASDPRSDGVVASL